ncbi:MAG: hypothetical protein K6G90_05415 [Clostridia bacterium]|nr:hypothetical protein [Clostridia bacterium]
MKTDISYDLNNGLRRGARYDSIFFGCFSGGGSTFDIRVRLDLKSDLDIDLFQRAADEALKCYPEFAVRPVIHGGKICYEQNLRPVRLYPDNGQRLLFGTDGVNGTNGYLFVFLYGKRHVTLSLFHGMTDAHGMIAYIITLMWLYMRATHRIMRFVKPDMFTKHGIRVDSSDYYKMSGRERFDPLSEFAADIEPIRLIDPDRMFRLPKEVFSPDDLSCRLINLEISNKRFLKMTKELGTSFAPLLSVFAAEAIADAYDVGDKTIAVNLTVDPRRQLGTNSFGNMSYNLPLPITKADLELPLRELCARLRSDMHRQLTRENAQANFNFILGQCDQVDAMGDIVAVNKTLNAADGVVQLSQTSTIFLTYPGRIAANPISRAVLDGVSPGMLAVERAIVVYAHKDSLIIQVTQKSDDMTLADSLYDTLCRHGFEPKKKDMGRVTQNTLELEKLARK